MNEVKKVQGKIEDLRSLESDNGVTISDDMFGVLYGMIQATQPENIIQNRISELKAMLRERRNSPDDLGLKYIRFVKRSFELVRFMEYGDKPLDPQG